MRCFYSSGNYSFRLSLSIVIPSLFSSILGLERSQSPRVILSVLGKSLASPGDGPYKLPNKKEELSSALAINLAETLGTPFKRRRITTEILIINYNYQLITSNSHVFNSSHMSTSSIQLRKGSYYELHPFNFYNSRELLVYKTQQLKFVSSLSLISNFYTTHNNSL